MELGFGEIVVIAAIVLLLFGPKKLPQLGEALGRGIRNFKDGMSGKDDAPGESPAQQALPPAPQAGEQTIPASEQTVPAQPPPGASSVNGVPARDAPR